MTRAAAALLDLLGPRACAACDTPGRQPFCPDCESRIVSAPLLRIHGVDVLGAASYTRSVSRAVCRLKYENRPDLAVPLGAFLAARLPQPRLSPDCLLVPVPLHPRRLAERGYNQAALLAYQLSRRIAARWDPLALCRVRNTPQLAGSSPGARAAATQHAFVVRHPRRLRHARVVLVDDVVTTGATAGACVAALRAAEVAPSCVVAVAVAGGPPPDRLPDGTESFDSLEHF